MNRSLVFIVGFSLMLLAIADMAAWIIIANGSNKNFEETVAEYLSLFPDFIANAVVLTILNILLFLIAIVCFVYSKQKTNKASFKILYLVLIIFSSVLAFWNLFSLM